MASRPGAEGMARAPCPTHTGPLSRPTPPLPATPARADGEHAPGSRPGPPGSRPLVVLGVNRRIRRRDPRLGLGTLGRRRFPPPDAKRGRAQAPGQWRGPTARDCWGAVVRRALTVWIYCRLSGLGPGAPSRTVEAVPVWGREGNMSGWHGTRGGLGERGGGLGGWSGGWRA